MVFFSSIWNVKEPGENSRSVSRIKTSVSPLLQWRAMLDTPLLKGISLPPRLRVPSGKTNRLPPAARWLLIPSRFAIMAGLNISTGDEGTYPALLKNQPKMGTEKNDALTIVVWRSKSDTSRIG